MTGSVVGIHHLVGDAGVPVPLAVKGECALGVGPVLQFFVALAGLEECRGFLVRRRYGVVQHLLEYIGGLVPLLELEVGQGLGEERLIRVGVVGEVFGKLMVSHDGLLVVLELDGVDVPGVVEGLDGDVRVVEVLSGHAEVTLGAFLELGADFRRQLHLLLPLGDFHPGHAQVNGGDFGGGSVVQGHFLELGAGIGQGGGLAVPLGGTPVVVLVVPALADAECDLGPVHLRRVGIVGRHEIEVHDARQGVTPGVEAVEGHHQVAFPEVKLLQVVLGLGIPLLENAAVLPAGPDELFAHVGQDVPGVLARDFLALLVQGQLHLGLVDFLLPAGLLELVGAVLVRRGRVPEALLLELGLAGVEVHAGGAGGEHEIIARLGEITDAVVAHRQIEVGLVRILLEGVVAQVLFQIGDDLRVVLLGRIHVLGFLGVVGHDVGVNGHVVKGARQGGPGVGQRLGVVPVRLVPGAAYRVTADKLVADLVLQGLETLGLPFEPRQLGGVLAVLDDERLRPGTVEFDDVVKNLGRVGGVGIRIHVEPRQVDGLGEPSVIGVAVNGAADDVGGVADVEEAVVDEEALEGLGTELPVYAEFGEGHLLALRVEVDDAGQEALGAVFGALLVVELGDFRALLALGGHLLEEVQNLEEIGDRLLVILVQEVRPRHQVPGLVVLELAGLDLAEVFDGVGEVVALEVNAAYSLADFGGVAGIREAVQQDEEILQRVGPVQVEGGKVADGELVRHDAHVVVGVVEVLGGLGDGAGRKAAVSLLHLDVVIGEVLVGLHGFLEGPDDDVGIADRFRVGGGGLGGGAGEDALAVGVVFVKVFGLSVVEVTEVVENLFEVGGGLVDLLGLLDDFLVPGDGLVALNANLLVVLGDLGVEILLGLLLGFLDVAELIGERFQGFLFHLGEFLGRYFPVRGDAPREERRRGYEREGGRDAEQACIPGHQSLRFVWHRSPLKLNRTASTVKV